MRVVPANGSTLDTILHKLDEIAHVYSLNGVTYKSSLEEILSLANNLELLLDSRKSYDNWDGW